MARAVIIAVFVLVLGSGSVTLLGGFRVRFRVAAIEETMNLT